MECSPGRLFEDFSTVTPLERLTKSLASQLSKWLSGSIFPTSTFATEFTWESHQLRLVLAVDIHRNLRFCRWYGTDAVILLGLSTKSTPTAPFAHVNPLPSDTLVPLLLSSISCSLSDTPIFTISFPTPSSSSWAIDFFSPSLSLLVPVRRNQSNFFIGRALLLSSPTLSFLDCELTTTSKPPTLSDFWLLSSSSLPMSSSIKNWFDGYCCSTPLVKLHNPCIFSFCSNTKGLALTFGLTLRSVFPLKPFKHYLQNSSLNSFQPNNCNCLLLNISNSCLAGFTSFSTVLRSLQLLNKKDFSQISNIRKRFSRKWKRLTRKTIEVIDEIDFSQLLFDSNSDQTDFLSHFIISFFKKLCLLDLFYPFSETTDFDLLKEIVIFGWKLFIEAFVTNLEQTAGVFVQQFGDFPSFKGDYQKLFSYFHIMVLCYLNHDINSEHAVPASQSDPLIDYLQFKMQSFKTRGLQFQDFFDHYSNFFSRKDFVLLNNVWNSNVETSFNLSNFYGSIKQNLLDLPLNSNFLAIISLVIIDRVSLLTTSTTLNNLSFLQTTVDNCNGLVSEITRSIGLYDQEDFLFLNVFDKIRDVVKKIEISISLFKLLFSSCHKSLSVIELTNSLLENLFTNPKSKWVKCPSEIQSFLIGLANWDQDETVHEWILIRDKDRLYAAFTSGIVRICKRIS
ncbi:hypothetical protein P9112_002551 [Eukaryota sp. TZLM1-RC]